MTLTPEATAATAEPTQEETIASLGRYEFGWADSDAAGASSFLPFGYVGVWAAIPYAIWFFLAVEGVPLAAEEAKNPKRDLPRGLIGAMLVLATFALLILFIGIEEERSEMSISSPVKPLYLAVFLRISASH